MRRTPLHQRSLPNFSRSNEIANMVTHIVGGGMGVVVLCAAIIISVIKGNAWSLVGGIIYGVSMIALYSVSSVYHGLKPCTGKKVMQVVDHCTIFLLIAGTYTPVLLSALRPLYPKLAWGILIAEWLIAAVGATFTGIDPERYGKFAMVCYIGMGWLIMLAIKPTYIAVGNAAFLLLLFGGISYTVGAVCYGIGDKNPWMHTVFHVFVDLGSILQAIAILFYVL